MLGGAGQKSLTEPAASEIPGSSRRTTGTTGPAHRGEQLVSKDCATSGLIEASLPRTERDSSRRIRCPGKGFIEANPGCCYEAEMLFGKVEYVLKFNGKLGPEGSKIEALTGCRMVEAKGGEGKYIFSQGLRKNMGFRGFPSPMAPEVSRSSDLDQFNGVLSLKLAMRLIGLHSSSQKEECVEVGILRLHGWAFRCDKMGLISWFDPEL